MKRKTLTLVLCLLTVLSLVGVGFASWVITATTSESEGGNIVVDTVNDTRYTLTITAPGDDSIKFTAPAGATDGWLTSDTDKTAVLSVNFNCTLTKNNGEEFELEGNYIKGLYYDVDFAEPAETKKVQKVVGGAPQVDENEEPIMEVVSTGYKEAKDANIINAGDASMSDVTLSPDKKTATFTLTVTYEWGTLFGGQNPFNFYNAKKANDKCGAVDGTTLTANSTWADHANYYLTILSQIDADCKYGVTVTVSTSTFEGASQAQKAA